MFVWGIFANRRGITLNINLNGWAITVIVFHRWNYKKMWKRFFVDFLGGSWGLCRGNTDHLCNTELYPVHICLRFRCCDSLTHMSFSQQLFIVTEPPSFALSVASFQYDLPPPSPTLKSFLLCCAANFSSSLSLFMYGPSTSHQAFRIEY